MDTQCGSCISVHIRTCVVHMHIHRYVAHMHVHRYVAHMHTHVCSAHAHTHSNSCFIVLFLEQEPPLCVTIPSVKTLGLPWSFG